MNNVLSLYRGKNCSFNLAFILSSLGFNTHLAKVYSLASAFALFTSSAIPKICFGIPYTPIITSRFIILKSLNCISRWVIAFVCQLAPPSNIATLCELDVPLY